MKPKTWSRMRLSVSFFAVILIACTSNEQTRAEISKVDLAAFRNYLVKTRMEDRWVGEPARLDSDEIRQAYGDRRFYFTFVPPPLPPGAALPDLIKKYEREVEQYRKHSLRITVGIDNKHSVLAFQKVNSNVDAKIAAAAILSLSGTTHVSPGVIVAKEVRLTKGNGGWTCSVTRPRGFDGTVAFDAGGKCAKVAKVLNYIPPMPP